MSANTLGRQLHDGQYSIKDPGTTKTITVDKSMSVCHLVSATAETRTLGRPTSEGVIFTLYHLTDGGDITVTVTGNHNETGDSTLVFSDVGQFATFISFQTSAGVYFWRLVSHHGLGNISFTESGSLDGVTATAAELNGLDADLATNVLTAGAGVSAAETYKSGISRAGSLIITRIVVDLTGLVAGAQDLDIIGNTGGATSAHFGQITAAKSGTIAGGMVTCLELPAGGADDSDFYSANESTGAQDASVASTLTETALITAGGAWASGTVKGMTTVPPASDYLYICCGEASAGTYSAGKFLIELYGY